MNTANRFVLAVIAAALLAPVARTEVLVVGPGDEYASVVAAAQAAQTGDVVLVRPGTYTTGLNGGQVVVFGKGITIAGDGTGPVTVGPILVVSQQPGTTVVLRHLDTMPPTLASDDAGLGVQFGNAGSTVWAEDCVFRGQDGVFSIGAMPASPGVRVATAGEVVLVRCAATGGEGVDTFFPYAPTPGRGGHGVDVIGAGHVQLLECDVDGGRGGDFVGFDGGPGPGGNGGDAVFAPGGNVLVSGSTLRGGDGGTGDELVPSPAFYAGGDGIDASGAAYVRVADSSVAGGAGGPDGAGGFGPTGETYRIPAGTLLPYAGSHRSFELGGPTPEGSLLQLDYRGEPGDLVGVYVSLSTISLPLVFKQGTWVLAPPILGPYLIGTTGRTGELSLSVGVPDFGFGPDDALVLFEQVLARAAGGQLVLSSPSTHVIVDGGL